MTRTSSRGRTLLGTTLSLLTIAALSGCSLVASHDAKREDATGKVTASSNASVFSVRVGDCLNAADLSGEVQKVPAVPCTEPHDAEIIAEQKLTGDARPTEDEITSQADTFCRSEFESWAGVAFDDSDLDVTYMYPTKDSWAQGDRTLQCIVQSAEKVSGTMKGSGASGATSPTS